MPESVRHLRARLVYVFFITCIPVAAAQGQHPVDDWLGALRTSEGLDTLRVKYAGDSLPKDAPTASALQAALYDINPVIRRAAAAALGDLKLDQGRSVPNLTNLLFDDDSAVRAQATVALIKFGSASIPALIGVLRDEASRSRELPDRSPLRMRDGCHSEMFVPSFLAAWALGVIGKPAVRPLLDLFYREVIIDNISNNAHGKGKSKDTTASLHMVAYPPNLYIVSALGWIGSPAVQELMIELQTATGRKLNSETYLVSRTANSDDASPYADKFYEMLSNPDLRDFASGMLGRLKTTGRPLLLKATHSQDPNIQFAGIKGLIEAQYGDVDVEGDLASFVDSPSQKLSSVATEGLSRNCIGSPKAFNLLAKDLNNPDVRIRRNAASAMRCILDSMDPSELRMSLAPLRRALNDSDPTVQNAAVNAIAQLREYGGAAAPEIGRLIRDGVKAHPQGDQIVNKYFDSMGKLGPEVSTIEVLRELVFKGPEAYRLKALESLTELHGITSNLIPQVAELLRSKDQQYRRAAASALGKSGTVGMQQLTAVLVSPDQDARQAAIEEVGTMLNDTTALSQLIAILNNRNDPSWRTALEAVAQRQSMISEITGSDSWTGRIQPNAGSNLRSLFEAGLNYTVTVKVLGDSLRNDKSDLRRSAVEALGALGSYSASAVPDMLAVLPASPDSVVTQDRLGASVSFENGLLTAEIVNAIKLIGPTAEPYLLRELLRTESVNPATVVLAGELGSGSREATEALKQLIQNPRKDIRMAALTSLSRVSSDSMVTSQAAQSLLNDASPKMRLMAAQVLSRSASKKTQQQLARDVLDKLLGDTTQDGESTISVRAAETIIGLGDSKHDDATLLSVVNDAYIVRFIDIPLEQFYDRVFKVCVSDIENLLPPFPWPPPAFSERDVLPHSFFSGSETTLGDVDAKLSTALKSANFDTSGLFSIPGGYVRVSRLERISQSGAPVPPPNRWTQDHISPRNLLDYLGQLFLENPGFFRLIVFAVTDKPAVPQGATLNEVQARTRFLEGGVQLPMDIAKLKFDGRECYVLIYEFEKTPGRTQEVIPSPVSTKEHLIQAGLWSSLAGSAR